MRRPTLPSDEERSTRLLDIRCGLVWLPHEKLDLRKVLPTLRIERI